MLPRLILTASMQLTQQVTITMTPHHILLTTLITVTTVGKTQTYFTTIAQLITRIRLVRPLPVHPVPLVGVPAAVHLPPQTGHITSPLITARSSGNIAPLKWNMTDYSCPLHGVVAQTYPALVCPYCGNTINSANSYAPSTCPRTSKCGRAYTSNSSTN